jgi:hypothetical protein
MSLRRDLFPPLDQFFITREGHARTRRFAVISTLFFASIKV